MKNALQSGVLYETQRMPLSLEKVAKTAKHHSFVYDYSQRKSHCMYNLTCRCGPGRPARMLTRVGVSQVAVLRRLPRQLASSSALSLVAMHLASSAFRQTGRHFSPFLTRWHTLSCRRRHIDTHHHASQVSNETDASAPAHWLSRASTCITFCIARSAHIDMHRSLHACSVHITVSNGVQPYTYAPVFMDSPIRYWSLLLLCGVSSAACVAGFFFGMQLARPHSASGQKFLRGFCPNPHSCCVHTD